MILQVCELIRMCSEAPAVRLKGAAGGVATAMGYVEI
jgi:hypothetical protein